MGIPDHDLDTLEQRRLALEKNISELQKSLYHWRTWEAEYDGLREEIQGLEDDSTAEKMRSIVRQYEGSLVNDAEIQAILRTQAGVDRSRTQVVDLLGRRIDYVKQNVATMEKRLRAAEDGLYTLDSNDQPPSDVSRGQAFPLSEIVEELDEEGNVISSSVNNPGDHASDLLEALKKAGVENIPQNSSSTENATASTDSQPAENAKTSESFASKAGNEPPAQAEEREVDETSVITDKQEKQEDDLDLSKPVSLVTPEDRAQSPITDIDEPADEATLRREMLEYGIHEVGAIVAELELDDNASEFSVSDEEYAYGTEDEEDEDEYGRSHTFLSEEYHQQMRELEAKLNARGMTNLGKDTETFPEEIRQEIQTPDDEPTEEAGNVEDVVKEKKPKKKVAFAEELDIAPSVKSTAAEKKDPLPKPQASVQVLSDAIVERTAKPHEPRPATVKAPKKGSRFRSTRALDSEASTADLPAKPTPAQVLSQPMKFGKQSDLIDMKPPANLFPATPQGPKPFSTPIADNLAGPSAPKPPVGKTLADKLVERDIAPGSITAPAPDELDEQIHRREIASEFYRMRNSKIQAQGGFVDDEEPEFVPIEEPTQKVSRFKAARIKP
ncbi:Uncharacterized protein PECH_001361 [Penicillium ucsense]|uniref:DUF3835 domain-containing protein n=1 Tax=Penicillium ucsense TaxID=2839758 RepID=A0A8J8VYW8_9EURO|nr:Uncharacterized protein PECM_008321 [Penicillium ucsense]KAF7732934.1 Uncharacterized protein PECH_001361 [Penicillium ucsense]